MRKRKLEKPEGKKKEESEKLSAPNTLDRPDLRGNNNSSSMGDAGSTTPERGEGLRQVDRLERRVNRGGGKAPRAIHLGQTDSGCARCCSASGPDVGPKRTDLARRASGQPERLGQQRQTRRIKKERGNS